MKKKKHKSKSKKKRNCPTEFELPKEIIQHIQSFLNGKEAAKTCLLSKSWYHAWSTRPILVLERFQDRKIQDYARKTIKRYKDLSLKLDKLVVHSNNCDQNFDELIADASTLGVTELDLHTCKRVPSRVFEIASLTKLSVTVIRIQDSYHTWFPTVVSLRSINVPEFHKLHSLSMGQVRVDDYFFAKFSSSFPHVEDLTVDRCCGYVEIIRLSSSSLKYFKLHHHEEKLRKAEFDFPYIRKFVFKITHEHIPALYFRTKSRGWDAELEFGKETFPDSTFETVESSWFIKLREFMKQLRSSRISLSVDFKKEQLIYMEGLRCSSAPVVENLFMNKYTSKPVTYDLLCALFRCCRPTLISMDNFRSDDFKSARLLYYLFLQNRNNNASYADNSSKSHDGSFLMYDLKGIDVEILEEKEWQSTPLAEFVRNVDPMILDRKQFRFRLKWGAFRCS